MRNVFVNCLRKTSPKNVLFSYPYREIREIDNRKTKKPDMIWLKQKEELKRKEKLNFFETFHTVFIKDEKERLHVKHHGLISAGFWILLIQHFMI